MYKIICMLLLCLVWAFSSVSADTITLKNGKEFEGNIYDFKGSMVKMEKSTGESFVIQVKQIQSVDTEDVSEDKQALVNDIQSQLTGGPARKAASIADRLSAGQDNSPESTDKRKKYAAPEYDFIEKPVFTGGPEFGRKPGSGQEEDDEGEEDMDLGDTTRGRFKKNVELFVGPGCPDCAKMENFLIENDIKYQSYNIISSPAAKNRYETYRVKVLPVTVVNGQTCLGYQPEQVRYLLMKSK